MYELVTAGSQNRPSLSKAHRRGRMMVRGLSALIAIVCIASIIIGSILSAIEQDGHARLLRSSQLQNESTQVMMQFRWMVQSWKNVLIRGHNPVDREQYWQELVDHHERALRLVDALETITQVNDRALLGAYRQNQKNLFDAYRKALALALASPAYDYRRADTEVRGMDRTVLAPLEKLVEHSQKLETEGYEEHFDRIRQIHWATLLFFLLLLIGLWIGFSWVIRLRMQQEDDLEMQNTKLQILGRMSANIIHEIKGPVTVIDGRCQQMESTMKRSPHPDATVMLEHLRAIFKVNDRIVRLIQSISRYARLSDDLPMAPLNFPEIIRDVELIARGRLLELAIQLQIIAPEEISPVNGREIEISQVLINLIVNAADAIETLRERWVRLEVTESKGFVELRVHDSGPGIPKHQLQNLSRNFYTTKSIGKGTGQGLAIIRRIVAEHGGFFAYDDSLQHTCFVVGLPTIPPSLNSAQTTGSSTISPGLG